MNYAQATDKELNNKLLELIHGDVVNYWCLSDDETFIYDCGPIGEDFHKIEIKDYCNDWNATMPLAVEHKIYHQECNGFWDCGYSSGGGMFAAQTHYVTSNKNPLRAIVICLIKVLEAKNGN